MNKTVSRLLALAMDISLVFERLRRQWNNNRRKTQAEGGNTTEQSGEKKEEAKTEDKKEASKDEIKDLPVRLLHLVSWKPSTFCTLTES